MATPVFIEDLTVGMFRTRTKLITSNEIAAFGAVSGDRNPVHFCEEHARASVFGGIVAHGMLSASLFSGLLGEDLPGPGTIYLGQTLNFRAPVRPGETVEATVRVSEINLEKRRVTLECVCKVGDKVVLDGQAEVLAPSRAAMSRAA